MQALLRAQKGKQFPELDGYYLGADYVTGKIWALMYSEKEKRVTEWRSIRDKSLWDVMTWPILGKN